jgi:hypothetical protein
MESRFFQFEIESNSVHVEHQVWTTAEPRPADSGAAFRSFTGERVQSRVFIIPLCYRNDMFMKHIYRCYRGYYCHRGRFLT